ncbi:DnaD domain protein [Streptococcus dysgalactiae subsp. equisimilis]|uniref:DnaD domain protein n=1 Tax=Streptococcus dysgalactiae TaxID=1334 RepID=UPI001F141823|nr:DnaD domain protein [Streptococcus dysgalactiae]MCD0123937.1 DnaD domain protein [Streptococcus agalactiae]MCL6222267.1 DnaD domain protein [Streptococcus dysgalactiae subsp. equisimilis]UMY67479.1 DnaD domain protein [Streptococcus dysgalactiae subsp. equisimilis]
MAQKSKTKIYYWLKFDKHFFDNLFIKRLLRNFPGGSEMIVIYIRLMLEAIENDCIIDYEGTFDNYAEELALRLETSEEQINMALAYFVKCGVIQVDDGGNTHYPQAKALLGQETNWNRYKKKQAELEKFQLLSNQVPTEIEIEKDKKIDINIDIKTEVEEEIKDSSATADEKSNFNIFEYYQSRIGVLDGYQAEKLSAYIKIDKLESKLVKRAIDRAADNSKRSFGYVNSILKSWAQNGITTITQQDEEQRQFQSKKSKQEEVSEYDTW